MDVGGVTWAAHGTYARVVALDEGGAAARAARARIEHRPSPLEREVASLDARMERTRDAWQRTFNHLDVLA